jgi:outer membrane protein assembly factor BamA
MRARELDAGVLVRISKVRFSHATLAAFHVARDRFDCPSCAVPVAADLRRASMRVGWEFSSARAFGYSISAEEGARAALTAESTRETLGADGDGFALTVEARRYWRARPRHAVIAVRGAAARSWGDEAAERRFSAGGSGPRGGGLDFGSDAVGLMRGYDEGALLGTRAVVANADYRVPLRRIDRGIGTWPIFFRSVHAAMFADVGKVWDDGAWGELHGALGAELSVDTVVGFVLPVTFTAGVAWKRGAPAQPRPVVAFGRIGRAF